MNTARPSSSNARRSAVWLALCMAVLPASWAAYEKQPPAATPPARAAVRSELPAEFSAIRPADIDGASPAIPPSELWPAQ